MELFRLFGSIFVEDQDARRRIEETDNAGKSLGERFSELAENAGKFALGLAGVGAAAVGGLIVKGVDAAQEMSKALNGLQSSTGVSDEMMSGLHDTLLEIYGNNFGDSFEDIGKSLATVKQQTGASGDALKDMTQDALTLRDTFEFEVNESTRSAKMLMDQFGLSGKDAYNLIAQGAQWGLDKNGDLLDTINEYSVHFQQLGLNSEEMFNMLANGAASGTFSVDKLGDAVKEFGIRSKDGSKTSLEAFSALGLNAQQISNDFAQGGEKGKAAFELVTSKLLAMKDPLLQGQTGVALFGTQWEDLGVKGIAALTNMEGEIGKNVDALGKINSVKYNTFGESITGIGRQLEVGLFIPLGEKILPKMNDLATWINDNMPTIKEVSKQALDGISSAIDNVSKAIENVMDFYKKHETAIQALGAGITAGAAVFGLYTLAINASAIATGIWSTVTGIATGIGGAFAAVLAFITSPIGIVIIIITALVATIVLLYKNWDTVKQKTGEAWEFIKTKTLEVFNSMKTAINEFITKVAAWGGNLIDEFVKGIQSKITKVTDAAKMVTDTIKDYLGFHSPSKLGAGAEADTWAPNLIQMFSDGMIDNMPKITNAASNIVDSMAKEFGKTADVVRDTLQKIKDIAIDEASKMGDALKTALKNQYESQISETEDFYNREIDAVRNATNEKIAEYQREYWVKTDILNDFESANIKQLQSQIDGINNLTKEEEKAAKEREYLRKKGSLESEIASAKTPEEKLRSQRELDDLIADHDRQEVLDTRQRQIAALKAEIQAVKDNAAQKRDEYKTEYEAKKGAEESKLKVTIDNLNAEKGFIIAHYKTLLSEENLQGEARKLMIEDNQEEIIKLLQTYNPKWMDAGQSFGQSLIDGLNSKKSSIESLVNTIMSKVNYASSLMLPTQKIPGRAIGDNNWQGGLVEVNENGGEIINLPSGSQIIPNDISRQMAQSASGKGINIIVQGNVIGTNGIKELAKTIGEVLSNDYGLSVGGSF